MGNVLRSVLLMLPSTRIHNIMHVCVCNMDYSIQSNSILLCFDIRSNKNIQVQISSFIEEIDRLVACESLP